MKEKFTSYPIGNFCITQRISDGYFNATSLIKQWNNNSNSTKKLDNYFNKLHTSILIDYIKNNTNTIPFVRTRASRGLNYGTWMNVNLFLDFSSWIDVLLGDKIRKQLICLGLIEKDIDIEVVRNEISHLINIESALKITKPKYKIDYQYQCLNGRYKIDMLISYKHSEEYDDGSIEKFIDYIIIEYDEEHHKRQIKADKQRERDITNFLVNESIKNGLTPSIEIIRIPHGKEGLLYAYAIPYITGVNNSTTSDDMQKLGILRFLYVKSIDVDIFNIGFKY